MSTDNKEQPVKTVRTATIGDSRHDVHHALIGVPDDMSKEQVARDWLGPFEIVQWAGTPPEGVTKYRSATRSSDMWLQIETVTT